MAFVVNAINRGISTTIGLAAEKYHDHKDRKAALSIQEQSTSQPSATQPQNSRAVTDEEDWALDEAADPFSQQTSNEAHNVESETTVEELVQDSIVTHPQESPNQPPRLQYPIIIPQRRPGTKTRGFARAYPPDLNAFGIDQESFLKFLKNFHSASQASPFLQAIFISASAISPIHGSLTFAISLSVQIALGTVINLQERYKANAFLDQMNKELFMPLGLYAMVLVYKQNKNTDDESSTPTVGVETLNMETAKQISAWGVQSTKTLRPIRGSDGTTKGEAMMPLEVAPLIYPGLDDALQQPESMRNESLKQRMSRNKKFVQQYFDRRATAEYAGNNPSAMLTSTSSTSSFRSKFADPNHPVNNQTTVALVTGGKYGHISPGTPGYRETGEDGRLKPENTYDPKLKDVWGPIGLINWGLHGVTKVLGSDVMYLTIVNMPSEEELAEAKRVLEENKKGFAEMLGGMKGKREG